MTDRVMQSESVAEFATAFAEAQGEMIHVKEGSANPFFDSKYANLADIWKCVRPILAKHGFSVIQSSTVEDGLPVLVTTLMHSSGQWVRGWLPILNEKNTAQGQGGGITYARRYALASMVGTAPESDDDGNAASGTTAPAKTPQRTRKPKPAAKPTPKTGVDKAWLEGELTNAGIDRERFKAYLGAGGMLKPIDGRLSFNGLSEKVNTRLKGNWAGAMSAYRQWDHEQKAKDLDGVGEKWEEKDKDASAKIDAMEAAKEAQRQEGCSDE